MKARQRSPVVTTDIESELLPTERAIPIGLIVNELVMNAITHAETLEETNAERIGIWGSSNGGTVVLAVERFYDRHGGKAVFLSYLPAGCYVGEMALLERQPRTARVTLRVESARTPSK